MPIESAKQRALMYRRWVRWWNVLFDDIKTIAHHRDLYRKVRAIVQANPAANVPSAFFDWMQFAYATSQSVALRRLVDRDRRTLSLRLLIEEIADHPEVLSRRRFVRLYRGYRQASRGRKDFERVARGRVVDRRVIRRHLRDLLTASRRVHTFVDKHVAHRDRRSMRRLPTFADLDECVDIVEALAKQFAFILKAEGTSVVPHMGYGWDKPFRVAWL